MARQISRRKFFKTSAAIGASTMVGGPFLGSCSKTGKPARAAFEGISVIQGEDYFKNTLEAVGQLGGMECFVPKGARVAILANPQRNNPGAFTKPQILKAAIRMCKEAGAREVACISQLPDQNWEGCGLKAVLSEEGASLLFADRSDASQFRTVPIPDGVALKEAQIMNVFYDYDVFIDMPITKDHAGNKFTGTMKNLMGLNSGPSNRTFHMQNWRTDINAIEHLDQCIADLNTVIKLGLCIVDATEFITTNGPFGPGDIIKPKQVIAGTDRVAIDAYCCTLWGLEAKDIIMINKAQEHGLGEMDLSKTEIRKQSI